MIFTPISLAGAYLIDLEKHQDERGFFARSWCQREFSALGLEDRLVQCNVSFNHSKGTLRGLHLQLPPFGEAKLVRCTQGALYDVIVDLRADSDTYLQWVGVELTAKNRQALYIPQGFAHGFQTLEDDTEVFYQMSEFYAPDYSCGVRWNDPCFGVAWPLPVTVISQKDRDLPDYNAELFKGLTNRASKAKS